MSSVDMINRILKSLENREDLGKVTKAELEHALIGNGSIMDALAMCISLDREGN